MPRAIEAMLANNWFGYLARIVLTYIFWLSGLIKLIDFPGAVAEMSHFGLEPAVLFAAATAFVQLTGSALIILNRWTWLGAGMLAVFTALTIPIAHHFWTMQEEPIRTLEFYIAMEHITLIGAFMVVAWASVRERAPARQRDGQAVASVAGGQRPQVQEASLA